MLVRRVLSIFAPVSTLALVASLAAAAPAAPRATPATPAETFAAKTRGLERRTGLLTTWLDRKAGKLLFELPAPQGPRGTCGSYLYLEGIRTGLGSNPVGLDRGQSSASVVVDLRRLGGRVLLEQQNLRYRAQSADSNEVRTVRESFATSVLWAGEVLAEAADGRLLVDATSLLVRDAHGAAATLKATGQGSFTLDKERSALDPAECRSFPDNLEFDALLTFASDSPGSEVRETAPAPTAVTIVQHQSLVRLPDSGYRPRRWDPRSGSYGVLFADYARPIGSDLDVRLLVRHRLEVVDSSMVYPEVKKPIVYYVDPGIPEPIRTAVIEGASWWSTAFQMAGFMKGFHVELLPPGADPLDVRYNVIEWVHRATRGWSYGGGVIDPRTGEMIKGHVTLGSLRVRQDRLIFEGLAGADKTGSGAPDDPVQLSLARIRQLAAHEVGHALGFSHNFAASTYAARASVMDYPAPRVVIRSDHTLDFSIAYDSGVGIWDVQAVRYAYGQPITGQSQEEMLEEVLRENREHGYLYMSDADTRPAGAAHPLAAMWDNGADPIAELAHTLEVRRIALEHFGERNIAEGAPLARLAEVLAPLYFHHRYQMEAAAKSIGGLDYAYSVREGEEAKLSREEREKGRQDPDLPPGYPLRPDGGDEPEPVPAARQRAAMRAVIGTLDPALLDLPENVLKLLPPVAGEEPPHHEYFGSATAPAFDALGAAAAAADLTLSVLLPPERLARLVDFHRRDPSFPGVSELLDAIVRQVFAGPAPASERLRGIRRAIQAATVRRLVMASDAPAATPAVRAAIDATIENLRDDRARAARAGAPEDRALAALLARDLARHLDRPEAASAATPPGAPPDLPPGPPIGAWSMTDDCTWATPGQEP
jgi:hypothetical protein